MMPADCSFIKGKTSRAATITEVALSFMTCSKSAVEISSAGANECTPALLIRAAMGPACPISLMTLFTSSSLFISQRTWRPNWPSPLLDKQTTVQPRCVNSFAMAAPMPLDPPVTIYCASDIIKLRCSAFQKSLHPFFSVLATVRQRGQIGLHFQSLLERQLQCMLYRPARKPGGWTAVLGQISGKLKPPIHQPSGFQYLRSEEHTSELQSRGHLVCRLLLEKK